MIALSWNVQGLNSIPRQKVGHRLIDSQLPNVVFIQETKLTVDGLACCVSRIWPQGNWQGVGAQKSSGGLLASGT